MTANYYLTAVQANQAKISYAIYWDSTEVGFAMIYDSNEDGTMDGGCRFGDTHIKTLGAICTLCGYPNYVGVPTASLASLKSIANTKKWTCP